MSPLVRKLYHKMSIAILLQLIILLNVAVLQSTMIFNNIFFELLGFYISRKFLNKYNIVVSTLLWWYPVLIALLVRWAQLATFATETRYLLAADGFSCRAESHHGGNCQEALGRFSNKH
ncbi:hypothetical protein Y032_0055g2598 [Ancylostoma ceylanicum]|uniref:Uncharacterized protein n=1 Tax=Ancylostoma ceylanicum TaxID=53326 RepID=A0A016U6R1_9BILA|nr:hypothetical protein Y032_0055g2598 [Ancylostoma ceylanicum]